MSSTTNGYWMEGYSYTVTEVTTVDSQSYGQIKGCLRRPLLGGDWNDTTNAGSRASWCQNGTIGIDSFTTSTNVGSRRYGSRSLLSARDGRSTIPSIYSTTRGCKKGGNHHTIIILEQ